MNNIFNVRDCYGCGVCAVACPKKIITIKLNEEGFYVPLIEDIDKCINCGICLDVCAFSHDDLAPKRTEIHSYASWSNDTNIQKKCSSGGIGFEIAKYLVECGYKACGVKYNENLQRAEHFVADNIKDFIPSIGSKYIQSYTVDGFKKINRREKFLITGTPCQIDSFRRYIQRFKIEDNFILLDFFCHGVPSMLAWNKYLQIVEQKTGKAVYVSWRNKFNGWHDSWFMSIDGEKTGSKVNWNESYDKLLQERQGSYNSRLSKGDIFYKLFLGDFCCNPACQKNCKYKYDSSSADIRIGDLWGATYKNNDEGVSALIAFTSKGNDLIKNLKECTIIEHPFGVVAEAQMKKNAGKAFLAPIVHKMLLSEKNFSPYTWNTIITFETMLQLPKRIKNKIIRTLKH